MAYRVEFALAARRQFRHLARPIQERLRPRIDALADDPRPPGAEKLAAGQHEYRIRVGDYRVIYEVLDQTLVVLIVKVAHRGDVYRRLP